MIPVRLKKSELSECRQFASLRWQMARLSHVKNDRRDQGRTDNDIDELGIKAETAVAKLFGLDFKASAMGIDSGDDMYIDVGNKEVSIQVKASFYPQGKLLFKSLDSFLSELAILVTADTTQDDVMLVMGWVSQKHFREKCVHEDLGHGKCYTLDQTHLLGMSKLWEHIVTARFK